MQKKLNIWNHNDYMLQNILIFNYSDFYLTIFILVDKKKKKMLTYYFFKQGPSKSAKQQITLVRVLFYKIALQKDHLF